MRAADLLDEIQAEPEPERDHLGRYLLPHVDTGRIVPWTRATTWAQTLSDKFGLNQWEKRMVAKGLGLRPDLMALAASAPLTDKATLDRVAEAAKEAAQASSGANQGTAVHRFTEALDRGEKFEAPEPWSRDVAAYAEAMGAARITTIPAYIERIVVAIDLGVAGTFDRIVRLPDGRLVVLDVKTGRDLSFAWGEISIQLSIYANADKLWNGNDKIYEDMPDVDKRMALVAHMPVGQGTCELIEVDIEAGWAAATKYCDAVRAWRKRKDLAREYGGDQTLNRIAAARSVTELRALYEQAKQNNLVTKEVVQAIKRRRSSLKTTKK